MRLLGYRVKFYNQARGLEDDLAAQTKEAAKYLTALGDVYSKVQNWPYKLSTAFGEPATFKSNLSSLKNTSNEN